MIERKTATWDDRKEQKEKLDGDLRAGRIGEPTYILSLEILGFRPREARDEMGYAKGLGR